MEAAVPRSAGSSCPGSSEGAVQNTSEDAGTNRVGKTKRPSEHLQHELPEKTSAQQLATTLTALANAKGGTVLVGPGGLNDFPAAEQKVRQAGLVSEPPLPGLLTRAVDVGGEEALEVFVPSGLPDVYGVGGRYWIRQGKRNKNLRGKPLQQLMLERNAFGDGVVSFESRAVSNATLGDVDWERARQYLSLSHRESEAVVEKMSEEALAQALMRLGCIVREEHRYRPSYAGMLLFGKAPHRFVPGNEIIMVRYAGTHMSDEFLREDLRGTLPDQIRRAEAFLVGNMRKGNRLLGWQREEQTEYPLEAVREAVINAVAHRDYRIQGEGIRVVMFADRLEVYSPGRLPGHVTLENIVDERFSRNPIIVQLLVGMGFIESLGYGIDRMMQLMNDAGLPPPAFEETANGFKVTLQGQGEHLVSNGADPSRWAHLNLNERQQKALSYLTENDRITNRVYQELCPEVSPETIRRDLAELTRRGLLLKIGDKKATYYIFK